MIHVVHAVIVVCLIVVWVDSNFHYRMARIRFPGGHASDYQVETLCGKISIIRDVTRNYGSGKPGVSFRSGEIWKNAAWFPKPRWDVEHQKGPHFKGFIYAPYWLITSFAATSWVGVLLLTKRSRNEDVEGES